jgi:hypothetical protein
MIVMLTSLVDGGMKPVAIPVGGMESFRDVKDRAAISSCEGLIGEDFLVIFCFFKQAIGVSSSAKEILFLHLESERLAGERGGGTSGGRVGDIVGEEGRVVWARCGGRVERGEVIGLFGVDGLMIFVNCW